MEEHEGARESVKDTQLGDAVWFPKASISLPLLSSYTPSKTLLPKAK